MVYQIKAMSNVIHARLTLRQKSETQLVRNYVVLKVARTREGLQVQGMNKEKLNKVVQDLYI
jgi:hypothetical protein